MKKYQGTFLDCTICQKAVMYNNTILCIGCSHWIHMKCTHLSSDDINEIEKLEIPWFCNTCTTDIFPFSQIFDANKLSKILNPGVPSQVTTRRPRTKPCFCCQNQVITRLYYPNKYLLYNGNKRELCKPCSYNKIKLNFFKNKTKFLLTIIIIYKNNTALHIHLHLCGIPGQLSVEFD